MSILYRNSRFVLFMKTSSNLVRPLGHLVWHSAGPDCPPKFRNSLYSLWFCCHLPIWASHSKIKSQDGSPTFKTITHPCWLAGIFNYSVKILTLICDEYILLLDKLFFLKKRYEEYKNIHLFVIWKFLCVVNVSFASWFSSEQVKFGVTHQG